MSVTAPTRRPDAVPVDTWPQVNLLPLEVTQGRKLHSTKRLLVLVVAVVVLIATLGYVGSLVLASQAADELVAVKADTARLQEEKAQFAEVPQVLGSIQRAENARQQATASEILWPTYLEALRAVTPTGVSYDSMSVNVGTASQPYAGSTDPLADITSIGQVSFTARSTTLPDTAQWIDDIGTVAGFSNPWFSSAAVTEDDGVVYYQVEATVDLLPSALAGRFQPGVEQ